MTTGPAGQATFRDLPPGGGYSVYVTQHCHNDASQSASVTSDQTTDVEVVMTPHGTLRGKVTDADVPGPSNGLSGVTVTLNTSPERTATTDGQGYAAFDHLPSGSYRLRATRPGYTIGTVTTAAQFHGCDTVQAALAIRRIVLEIVDRHSGAVISGTSVNHVVGQKVELLVRTKPAGETMTNIRWTIPGTTPGSRPSSAVKSYTMAAARTNAPTLLAAGDLQGTQLDYYWAQVGSRSVQVQADVNGLTLTAAVTLVAQAPHLNSFSSVTAAIAIGTQWGHLEMLCGTPGGAGLNYTANVTAPAAFGGDLKFTQILQASLIQTPTVGAAQTWSIPNWWLDVQDPYVAVTAVAAGAVANFSSSDSPGMPLGPGFSRKQVAFMRFKLYVMFKPTGADTIWVPVAVLLWGWSGLAVSADSGANWTMSSGAQDTVNPAGAATNEFPVWVDQKTDAPPHPVFV